MNHPLMFSTGPMATIMVMVITCLVCNTSWMDPTSLQGILLDAAGTTRTVEWTTFDAPAALYTGVITIWDKVTVLLLVILLDGSTS